MHDDPIVNEVRKTRERLAEKYSFDISAIFKDLRERQGMLGKKLKAHSLVLTRPKSGRAAQFNRSVTTYEAISHYFNVTFRKFCKCR
jgi:hypothetical protein